ncbi:hypothetical protein [Telluribacter sp. SYSU D00476]|uniref:hypothetical protein n=1 Tax=Telluribacter sp. SYSU D00476 TaxID=2811430 RepID=UPI001FF5FC4F|nr:hypothetical protein [Telluribacter sp. SYSU D00476]
MRYLTANGKIISGASTLEVLRDLKNSTFYDANRQWEKYLDSLSLRVFLFYGEQIDQRDDRRIVNQLEELGFLLKLE